MQEVFEKIITNLETELLKSRGNMTRTYAFEKSIEIFKQAAEEYNNGWIPCSERLPELNGNYLVQIEESDGTAVLSFMDVEHCNLDGKFLHDYIEEKETNMKTAREIIEDVLNEELDIISDDKRNAVVTRLIEELKLNNVSFLSLNELGLCGSKKYPNEVCAISVPIMEKN